MRRHAPLIAALLLSACNFPYKPQTAGQTPPPEHPARVERSAPQPPSPARRRTRPAAPASEAAPARPIRLPPPFDTPPTRPEVAAAEPMPESADQTAPAPAAPSPGGPAPSQPPREMRWLYGSGEAAAASVQAYRGLVRQVLPLVVNHPADSVVLAEGATLGQPLFVPCGDKPLAVVLDIDETALLNLGYEYDRATKGRDADDASWDAWERSGGTAVAAVPGAAESLDSLRRASITVVFISNRFATHAAETEAALSAAGLGPAKHGETLFLQGDVSPGRAKDRRRAAVAARYCVVAMAGDQFGDFSDRFARLGVAARRAAATAPAISALWGAGWFVLPNPVYGPGTAGSFDDVFPADRRWTAPDTPSSGSAH